MNHEFAQIFGRPDWLIEPRALRSYLARAEKATPEAIAAAVAAYGQRQTGPKMLGDLALIECCGPITYKASWFSMYFGGTSIEEMQAQLRAALADPAARTIAFRWDSPGGFVEMVPEFADEIFAARGQKPIISVADTMIASAAYWLAAQTDAIYGSVSSMIGSIGVYVEHDDVSVMLEKAGVTITQIAHGDHKLDGTPYQPLSEEARAIYQAYVDEVGGEFDAAVARGRGVTKAVVLETFGQGQVFRGKQAIKLGLADKLGTFAQVVTKLTKGRAAARAVARTIVEEVHVHSDRTVVDVLAAASAKKAKASGCTTCGKSSCPCEEEECPVNCPTCDPECPCRQQEDTEAAAAAKAKAATTEAAATDEHGIIAAV